MIDPTRPRSAQIVTVFGGSGFIGRMVVAALARKDYRIRVAVRRPNTAGNVQPFGFPGQIHGFINMLAFPSCREHVAEIGGVLRAALASPSAITRSLTLIMR